jgi:hypothetical protein
MSYAYDYLALHASSGYKFTGKERDAESGAGGQRLSDVD